jgi:TatD DNase family protein
MLIDTHCHLDASDFDADRDAVIADALGAGIGRLVIPAVEVGNSESVARLARRIPGAAYTLGIHPLYVERAAFEDLGRLRHALDSAIGDPQFVGVGEIGLDHFVPGLDRARQLQFFDAQLRLAREYQLPVILHVRRAQDVILGRLRRLSVIGGIAHAFNGSLQQAQAFIDLGFKLGFGGALTYERALQLRRLATELPLSALVLETDAPDIPPHWLYATAEQRAAGIPQGRNAPSELPRIAQVLADLRGISLAELAAVTTANAQNALPRLQFSA